MLSHSFNLLDPLQATCLISKLLFDSKEQEGADPSASKMLKSMQHFTSSVINYQTSD
jgi:hypothetical protein